MNHYTVTVFYGDHAYVSHVSTPYTAKAVRDALIGIGAVYAIVEEQS